MQSNVLIVEDSPDVRSGLQIALESQGYAVQAAADGREGIKLFRDTRPDIALLDIRMPRLSGIDVCTLIRNESDVPIIMFSGVDERADVLLAIQRGANDYVLKDTGFKELLARVGKHLRTRAAELLITQPVAQGEGRVLPFSAGDADGQDVADLLVPAGSAPTGYASLNIKTLKVKPAAKQGNRQEELLENLVLVAHSEPESLAQLADIAGRTTFEVAKASTGREAIEILAARRPKLLLLGNVLTDMNCLGIVQATANHPLGELMGIVLALGKRSPELARRARYMGVQDVIYKPWNDGRLDIAIRAALAATRAASSRLNAA